MCTAPRRESCAPVSTREAWRETPPATRNVYFGDIESATDMPEGTAPSASPRRSVYRDTARKRAESVTCPSMFPKLINAVEALRTSQEQAERLIRLSECLLFSAILPVPPATVNNREASASTAQDAPNTIMSVSTFPAPQESPHLTDGCSQPCGLASPTPRWRLWTPPPPVSAPGLVRIPATTRIHHGKCQPLPNHRSPKPPHQSRPPRCSTMPTTASRRCSQSRRSAVSAPQRQLVPPLVAYLRLAAQTPALLQQQRHLLLL
ncbi:hypothetical protein HPB50_024661 [Hyalomma asiaticum]|uniref:Uncharacterized protein n=1 Tax=Hyalomma asiaticum TaxID=266040 RepID=A0ACB7RJU2_HYAAI|nr:hypothetical protein HPB50_024661 [Hyalomma asiaticum]